MIKCYIYLSTLLLIFPLQAKEPLPSFISVDGENTIQAPPIELAGEQVVFKRSNGTTFKSNIDKFFADDQKKLTAWRASVRNDLHQQVVNKVRNSENLKVLFIGNSYSFQVPIDFEVLSKKNGKK